jgi:hypothetical protein
MGTTGGECGIGLKVEKTSLGFVVSGLKHKYPAHIQGVLKVGHLIVSVDGIDVANSNCALPPLVLGQEGTPVAIGYIRQPGEAVQYVNVIRGGASCGAVKPLHVDSSSFASRPGLTGHDHSASLMESSDDPGMRAAISGTPFSELEGRPARSVHTRASSAMEIHMEGNQSAFASLIATHPPDSPDLPRRRSRSVALLPSSGTKQVNKKHLPSTPSWHIDVGEADLLRASASPGRSKRSRDMFVEKEASPRRVRYSSSDHPFPSPKQHAEEVAGGKGAGMSGTNLGLLSPTTSLTSTTRGFLSPTERLSEHGDNMKNSQPVEGVQPQEFVSHEALDEQQKQAFQIFARTPECKMLKAEQARLKHSEFLQKRSEWASNSVIGDIAGGQFGTSRPKSGMDWVVFFAQQIPGAGDYTPKLPPREGRKEQMKYGGATFGTSKRFGKGGFTDVDLSIPGAGAYDPVTKTLSTIGGRFNGSDKVTAMEIKLRQTCDLPGPGEYDNYDRDHRDIHLSKLAGKFSETARMGRDLAMSEAAKVPGSGTYSPRGTYKEPGDTKRIRGGLMLQTDGQTFVDQAARRARDIPGPLDTVYQPPRNTAGNTFSSSVVPSNVDVLCREARKIPGPGMYKPKAGHLRKFTSFTKSAPQTEIDKLAKRASKVPGPGAYDCSVYKNKLEAHISSTNIDMAKPPSDLDHHLRAASLIPGPGTYGAPKKLGPNPSGVKFSKGRSMSYVDLKMRDASQKPGPGQYTLSGVPDGFALPKTDKDWRAYISYFPQMRYRES